MKEININLDAISLLTNIHLKAGFSYLILKKKIEISGPIPPTSMPVQ